MYSSTSQFSNNPFIDDPTNSAGRFPDVNTFERSSSGYSSPSPAYGTSPYGGGYNPTYASPGQSQSPLGFAPTGQPQQYLQQTQSFSGAGSGGWGQQQQQPQPQQYGGGSYLGSSPSPYAPASSPVSPQMTGMPYQGFGGGQQYMQQPSGTYGLSPYGGGYGQQGYGQQGYGQPQQQQLNVSEFDPLRQQQQQVCFSSFTSSHSHSFHILSSPTRLKHPRIPALPTPTAQPLQ